MTIGGIAATLVGTANSTGGGADLATMWIAAVPTGTTGNVVINFSAAMVRCGCALYALNGLASPTPFHVQTNTTIGRASGGAQCAEQRCCAGWRVGQYNQLNASTWTGLTKDGDFTVETVSNGMAPAKPRRDSGPDR